MIALSIGCARIVYRSSRVTTIGDVNHGEKVKEQREARKFHSLKASL